MNPRLRLLFWGAVTLLALLIPLGGASPARAQPAAVVSEVGVAYIFGESVTIRGRAAPGVQSLTVSVQIPGDPRSLTAEIPFGADGTFEFTHRIEERFIQAFSTVEFHFLATLAGGAVQGSDIYAFYYEDNRFNWQVLERASIRVHWYAGDAAFAGAVLDAALAGLARANAVLEVREPEGLDIYVYGSLADYQFMRGQMGQLWAGGHADPAAGLVMVSLPPGAEQQLEIERKIPHEMGHIMLYQAAGAGFWNLPVWLNEGFASFMEGYPNPDYAFLVNSAGEAGTLIPLADLCQAFPRDASGALMAYAQATSLVRFLQAQYGSSGVRALVEAYAGGAGCETGTHVPPFGSGLAGLEQEWRASLPLGEPAPARVYAGEIAALTPWLVVGAFALAGPGVLLMGMLVRKFAPQGGW